jgi:glycosyltransferase involved in cell wall biosynthesis/peptidoglycan/xylan/chitin deacetylase (PgdA/CDA1 family)
MPAPEPPQAQRRRTRVLMAVHGAERGGAQLVALGQARALSRECDLVIAVSAGALRDAFAEASVAIVRGPTNLPIWGASPGRWALQVGRTVRDVLRFGRLVGRHRIDVVVVNSTVLAGPVIGARLAGVPVIVHAQEAPTSAAARRLFRLQGVLADTVVAISPWIEQAFDGARANVLLNPVGIPIPPDPGPRELCATDPIRLVMIATVDRHKRQAVAIRTVRALRDLGLEARLTLHGQEPDARYAGKLRQLARELGVARQVDFAGPTPDVAPRLLAADALLLPAGEVTPVVLMEAMALRTPVVAARMGSIPDIVIDDVCGLLVAPDDPARFAASVARLRHEPGLAARIAEAGRRRAEENFDETRPHRRLSAEIRRLAGRRDNRRPRVGASAPTAVVRRHLCARWRRTRAAIIRWRLRASPTPVAGALVYHETFRSSPAGEQVVPGITAAALERHLRHLRRSYELVPASELYHAMLVRRRGRPIPIAVTFDDDLASHLEVAAPLLRRLACPASFFLTGAGLDGPHSFWWQRLQAVADRGLDPRPALRTAGLQAPAGEPLAGLAAEIERSSAAGRAAVGQALLPLLGEDSSAYSLTRSQVQELARGGFELGFHTRYHRPLPELADDELEVALRDGRDALESVAGRPLHTIAYPHGRADRRVAAAAGTAGYTDGFAGPGGPITAQSDRLLLGRFELLLETPGAFEHAMARVLLANRRPVRRRVAEIGGAVRSAKADGAQR